MFTNHLEHFGSEDQQNHKRTAKRRQREKGQLRFKQRHVKKWLKEIQVSGDKTSIYKEKNPCHITSGKHKEMAVKEEKNGVLNVPKETLEAHLQKK